MSEELVIPEDLREMYKSTDPEGYIIKSYSSSVTRSLIERISRAEQRVKDLEQEIAALKETWRTLAGDGTDKLTPEGLRSLIEDYRQDVKALKAENERLKAPVSESWQGIADAKKGFDAAQTKEKP